MEKVNFNSRSLKYEEKKHYQRRIRIFQVLSHVTIFLMWAKATLSYLDFPEQIPLSFGIEGRPTLYGDKIFIFILCFSLSVIPQVISLITFSRKKIARKRRIKNELIDGYFIPIVETNFFISVYMLIVFQGLIFGIKEGKLPFWFFPFLLLAPIIISAYFVIRTIITLYKISINKQE
jgi:ABC-type multidrug transport system permease subunit